MALKFLIDQKSIQLKSSKSHSENCERIFKPSIIFMPSTIIHRQFRLLRPLWKDVFDIVLLCDASGSGSLKKYLIDNTNEFQNRIDHWAVEHSSILKAQTVVLASYEAGVTFMLGSGTRQPQPGKQMQDTAAQKHGANVLPREVTPEDDDQKHCETDEIDSSIVSRSEPDASTRKDHEKAAVHNDMWNLVMLDECHFINKETTDHHKLVKQLDRDALLLISSNPLTSLKDLYGYLRLMWDTAWPFNNLMEPESEFNMAIYNPETYDNLLGRESTHEAIRERIITGGIAPDTMTPRQRQRRAEYIKFILEGSGPAYLLHPELYRHFWRINRRDASAMMPAIQGILKMVSVRRGLLTPMRLPNDDITYTGTGVSGLTVRTVELTSMDLESVNKRLDDHISELLKYHEDLNVEPGEIESMLGSAICRRLSMISTDVNNIALTTPTKGLLNLLPALHGSSISFESMKESEYINWLARFDTTGDLEWLFYHTRELQRYSFPKDRLSQVRYAAWDSPKYCYVLVRALEAQERGEKLMVCVNNLLTSQ
jgi:hypothetical protein